MISPTLKPKLTVVLKAALSLSHNKETWTEK
jgi:hypothetical protein